MSDKNKWLDLLSEGARDSIISENEDAFFDAKADSVFAHEVEKRQHFEMYERLDDKELKELNSRILELQDSYSDKKDLIKENVESISSLAKDINSLSSTLEKSQSEWEKVEKDYVSQSIGTSVIPRFLESVFNYYPKDHPLYSPGLSSIEFGGKEKPSKARSLMDETRLSSYFKAEESRILTTENMRNKRDLLNSGKGIKQLRDEYYRASFKEPEGLLEEFKKQKEE